MKNNRTKKSKITVHPIGVCDIYEVGNWPSTYSFIKLGYELDKCDLKYSDIGFLIRDKAGISGYAIHKNAVIVDGQDALPIYSKKMVLCDFAISARAYAKYGKILIDHMINYARQNGYVAIEIKKEIKYSFFLDFLVRRYNVKEIEDSLYIFIKNPKIKTADKHLRLYDGESIEIEDIHFLRYVNFTVRKTVASFSLSDGEKITVDRKSGSVKFPQGVQVAGDGVELNDQTRGLISLIKELYKGDNAKGLTVSYKAEDKQYEVLCGDVLYVNKPQSEIEDDLKYVLDKIDRGIDTICSIFVEYDMNDNSVLSSAGKKTCYELIEKYSQRCQFKGESMIEKINQKKRAKEFNQRLNDVKRFDFRFGNAFCGIKKLTISFGECVEINSNGQIEKEIIPQREEIIRELCCFNFSGWQRKYDGNLNQKTENCWSVRLVLPDRVLEYEGLDDYPENWDFVEWFVNKYSKFILTKE